MGTLTSREQADALCTVIALGFIINSRDNNSYVIFQDGEEDKDKETANQHLLLRAKLEKLAGSKASFEFTQQRAVDKSKHPIILAQTNYSKLQPDIAEEEISLFNRLEDKINRELDIPLKGAYVGGLLTTSKTELLKPSILYWYDPKHRSISERDARDLQVAESSALSVTNAVMNFLNSELGKGKTLKRGGTLVSWADEPSLSAGMSNLPTGSQLFASVHGMTQSIIHYHGANNYKENVSIELALGKDTCKVASCIPCSIFMSANEIPASATHFGRGDNWNFPHYVLKQIQLCSTEKDWQALPDYVRKWIKYVLDAYDAGNACFTGKVGFNAPDGLQFVFDLNRRDIPQMFLEALTFESPFLDKMLRTLEFVTEK